MGQMPRDAESQPSGGRARALETAFGPLNLCLRLDGSGGVEGGAGVAVQEQVFGGRFSAQS